jgi:hypothetical protein
VRVQEWIARGRVVVAVGEGGGGHVVIARFRTPSVSNQGSTPNEIDSACDDASDEQEFTELWRGSGHEHVGVIFCVKVRALLDLRCSCMRLEFLSSPFASVFCGLMGLM